MICPWQTTQWQSFATLIKNNRVPQAILLSGSQGLGKLRFAKHLQATLHCEQRDLCGKCQACCLIRESVHPDALIVGEQDQTVIKVDEVRAITEFVYQTAASQNGYKTILIIGAHKMNINSANALLKTLEEPPSNVVFILVCDQLAALPATIVSRCQLTPFYPPDKRVALDWLAQMSPATDKQQLAQTLKWALDAPLSALDALQADYQATRKQILQGVQGLLAGELTALQLAHHLKDIEALPLIDLLLTFTIDILHLQWAMTQEVRHSDFLAVLEKLSKQSSVKFYLSFMDFLTGQRKLLVQGANLNKALLFDALFLRLQGNSWSL